MSNTQAAWSSDGEHEHGHARPTAHPRFVSMGAGMGGILTAIKLRAASR